MKKTYKSMHRCRRPIDDIIVSLKYKQHFPLLDNYSESGKTNQKENEGMIIDFSKDKKHSFKNIGGFSVHVHPNGVSVGVVVLADDEGLLYDITKRNWILSNETKSKYTKEDLDLDQLIGEILRYFECDSVDTLERLAYKFLNMNID